MLGTAIILLICIGLPALIVWALIARRRVVRRHKAAQRQRAKRWADELVTTFGLQSRRDLDHPTLWQLTGQVDALALTITVAWLRWACSCLASGSHGQALSGLKSAWRGWP